MITDSTEMKQVDCTWFCQNDEVLCCFRPSLFVVTFGCLMSLEYFQEVTSDDTIHSHGNEGSRLDISRSCHRVCFSPNFYCLFYCKSQFTFTTQVANASRSNAAVGQALQAFRNTSKASCRGRATACQAAGLRLDSCAQRSLSSVK